MFFLSITTIRQATNHFVNKESRQNPCNKEIDQLETQKWLKSHNVSGVSMSNLAFERAVALLGGQRSTARALTLRGVPVAQGHVWYWLKKTGKVPAEVANHLHCLTNGEVTREQLRPDVFDVDCGCE
jgi:DNA-binding transcriptional regulator YdaS (Cro superfamily)